MRRRRIIGLTLCPLALALPLVGCGAGPTNPRQPMLYRQPEPPQRDNASARQANPQESYEEAERRADIARMVNKLHALQTDNDKLKQKLSDQYMQMVKLRSEQAEAAKQRTASPGSESGGPGEQGVADAPPAKALADHSRQELLDALLKQIVDSQDPARTKAMMAAALSIASPGHDMDPRLLDDLDPRSREQVARFHQMVAVAFDELNGDEDKQLTRRAMLDKIDEVFGAQPLSIQAYELCRRVDGYGVYEPFANTRFLAGKASRVLVYVEVDNFHHEPTEDDQFEVRLEMQVELYDARGETTVWRSGLEELPDVSRNKRRDFFIVYPVDLPARLSAGGYRLKVRVADKHTGSICEQTMHNIEIVADRTLVKKPNP